MDPLIIGLVAFSAILHVAWNVRLKTAGDPLRTATVGMLAAAVVIIPVGILVWVVDGRPELPVDGHRARHRVRRHRSRLLRPAGRGLPPRRPVRRLPAGARDGAAHRGRDRGPHPRRAARRRRVARGARPARGVPVAAAAVADRRRGDGGAGGRAPGRDRRLDPVRPGRRRDDRDLLGHRPGRHPPDRAVVLRRDPVAGDVRLPGAVGHAGGRRRHLLRRTRGEPAGRDRRLADARRRTCASSSRSASRRCRAWPRCASRRRSSPRPGGR